MLICQWHLDIVYGKQGEAVRVMRAWGAEKFASSEFRRARGARLLAGFVGPSASHLVDEYSFDSRACPVPSSAVIRTPWLRLSYPAPSTGSSIGCWSSPDCCGVEKLVCRRPLVGGEDARAGLRVRRASILRTLGAGPRGRLRAIRLHDVGLHREVLG
jgi:hypothetical protein